MKRYKKLRIALLVFGGAIGMGVGPANAQNSSSEHAPVNSQQRALADEQMLAFTYRAEAQEHLEALAKQQALVNYWGRKMWMAYRLKLPNPYWSARTQAEVHRARYQHWSGLAAAQDRKIQQTLRSSTQRP